MKNLSPHRKFRGVSTIEPSMRPFYRRKWPEDLPKSCPICGAEFVSTGWNIKVGPNRIGRVLRNAAKWAFLPCMLGAFVVPILFDRFIGDWLSEYGGQYFLVMISIPALLGFASLLTPIRRTLECKQCGWNRDYQVGKTTPIPPPKGQP
ncbi:hypothetical protein HZ994_16320 [Akkermansiaceae bacterium]|nr:hypothetical protein HZ994_16320 [Akkermansiaceae bacterium]